MLVGHGGLIIAILKSIIQLMRILGLQVWERSAGTGYSSSKFYHNGQEQTKTSSASNGSPSGNGTWTEIGKNLSGKIGELIVLNSTDPDDRQKLEGYLAHKWGLTSSLPDSHPFKYTLPAHVKWERSIRITDQDGGTSDSDLTIRVVNNNDNAPVLIILNCKELSESYIMSLQQIARSITW